MSEHTAQQQLRVAVLGYGLAGSVFHGPLIAADPRMRVAAVVTSSAERAEQARAAHPGVRVLARADELFAAPEQADLVVIATPPGSHVQLTHAALAAGLPVVVDKPFTPTAAQGAELVEAAQKAGLLLSVFQNRRWDGDFLTVRRLIESGRLGAVTRFESRFERWRPVAKGGWRETGGAEEAAGLLYDLGSHLIDQALVLSGPVRIRRDGHPPGRGFLRRRHLRRTHARERCALAPVDERGHPAARPALQGARAERRVREVRPGRAGGRAARGAPAGRGAVGRRRPRPLRRPRRGREPRDPADRARRVRVVLRRHRRGAARRRAGPGGPARGSAGARGDRDRARRRRRAFRALTGSQERWRRSSG